MLTLEKLAPLHRAELAALGNDPIISATSSVDYPCTPDTVQDWMDESSGELPERFTFVIRVDGQIAGACSIKKIDYEIRRGELSYWVGRPFWGQGIARQAVAQLIEFAFGTLQLELLHAYCLKENNQASLRVLLALGFELDPSHEDHPTRLRWADAFPDDFWVRFYLQRPQ